MRFRFTYESNGFDESKPLIYVWHIGKRTYVGKGDKGATRPLVHYRRNVESFFAGKPYRANNPNGWRKVHIAMIEATKNRQNIRLEIVSNVKPSEDIFAKEQEWPDRLETDLNG